MLDIPIQLMLLTAAQFWYISQILENWTHQTIFLSQLLIQMTSRLLRLSLTLRQLLMRIGLQTLTKLKAMASLSFFMVSMIIVFYYTNTRAICLRLVL